MANNNQTNSPSKGAKIFTFSNIITGLLVLLVAAMLIFPAVKATFIQGLMKVGFFKADLKTPKETEQLSQQVFDFSITDAKGNVVHLAQQKDKVVFINFWATWCPPCIAEMPSINQLYLKYKDMDDVLFITVNVDGALEKSSDFMKKRQLDLPVYSAVNGIPDKYFSGSLPTTIILNKKGQLVYKHEGAANYASPEVEQYINSLR